MQLVLLIWYRLLYCFKYTGRQRRREVNNDIDCVSGRGGEPDTAMAG